MFRIDDSTAATSLPVPEAAGSEGYFTEGSPTTGTPATNVRGSWLNMIQEELCAILAAAGIARSKTTYNQVNSALQKMYAPVVGTMRNGSMSVPAASATATFTADEILVATALGGQSYKLASFSKTINLATTGAGGMDTGVAPASGFVAIYAIYSPTTQTAALLATNASSAVQPNVYAGSNMPAGYAASALVSVWRTDSSSQFVAGAQVDRKVYQPPVNIFSISTQTSVPASFGISGAVPKNARSYDGIIQAAFTTAGAGVNANVCSSTAGIAQKGFSTVAAAASGQEAESFTDLPILTSQTSYYTLATTSGASTITVFVTAYQF
ncbi:hypothetical protein [Paraburkholderia phenoliruptrix]|uniref:hypothetical protein n=1 Tax=Paraburkholderia phenoliruptrix TaxID=252970 RepID=UPI003D98028E